MAFNPVNMDFSLQLKFHAGNQLDFLEVVDKVPELKQPRFLARSVYRYKKYWLPFAAAHPDECLSAPLDIEWVWHCHMLSPRAYEKDCKEIVKTVVNHTLRSKSNYQDALTKSRTLWLQRYRNEEEPFSLDYNAPYDNKNVRNYETKIAINIIKAASRQKTFYYQVSLPHYTDMKFLEASLERYKKNLHLKQQLPEKFIVPC